MTTQFLFENSSYGFIVNEKITTLEKADGTIIEGFEIKLSDPTFLDSFNKISIFLVKQSDEKSVIIDERMKTNDIYKVILCDFERQNFYETSTLIDSNLLPKNFLKEYARYIFQSIRIVSAYNYFKKPSDVLNYLKEKNDNPYTFSLSVNQADEIYEIYSFLKKYDFTIPNDLELKLS